MNDDQLLRYSRQVMLPEIDIAGQEALLQATALIVGLGGLGSPVALYLAAAGVGRLVLADHDEVELSNLQRQIVHQQQSIGDRKVDSASRTLRALNPEVEVVTRHDLLSGPSFEAEAGDASIVIDATDNLDTRHRINDVCFASNVPLVSGAAIRWEGQVSVFDPRRADSPCYRCLYPEGGDTELNCAENGVIAPLVGIIGAIQALEVIKVLTGVGDPLVGYILYFDAKRMDWRKLKLPKDPACATCGGSDRTPAPAN